MRRNVERALRWMIRAWQARTFLDSPEYVVMASSSYLICLSDQYKDQDGAWVRGLFIIEDGHVIHHFSTGEEYDTFKMPRLVDYARERGLL